MMPPSSIPCGPFTVPTDSGQYSTGNSEYRISEPNLSSEEMIVSNEELLKTWSVIFQEKHEEVKNQGRKILCEIAVEHEDDSALIARLTDLVKQSPYMLFEIAENNEGLLSARALAARMAVALGGVQLDRQRVNFLAGHRSPMIRTGVMYGYADLGDIDNIRIFLDDPHQTVRAETLDVLDDLNE